jgi:hypothetical protein
MFEEVSFKEEKQVYFMTDNWELIRDNIAADFERRLLKQKEK